MTKAYKELLELKVKKQVSNIIFNMKKNPETCFMEEKRKKQQISTGH